VLAAISRQKFRLVHFFPVVDLASRDDRAKRGSHAALAPAAIREMVGAPRFRHKKRSIPIGRRAMLI